jgi:hypothetical protein
MSAAALDEGGCPQRITQPDDPWLNRPVRLPKAEVLESDAASVWVNICPCMASVQAWVLVEDRIVRNISRRS